MTKLCPDCKQKLEPIIFYKTEVDYCPKCLGIFFEEDELRQAKDAKDRNLSWLDIDLWEDEGHFELSPGPRLCPVCRMPFYQTHYGDSDIMVDICNLCHGIWLDRGEFKKIVNYLKEKADWEAVHNYGKSLFEEFREIFTGPETIREEVSDFLVVLKLLLYKFSSKHPFLTGFISKMPK
ncbi:MAG TPA: hypothetical protein ENL27_00980 [Candidatus Parcubacteria bacterium]|nr:hypothetical protein [Candidatus Parcubacteria bacterium]